MLCMCVVYVLYMCVRALQEHSLATIPSLCTVRPPGGSNSADCPDLDTLDYSERTAQHSPVFKFSPRLVLVSK